jgi:Domain of unknown function (DUF4160)
VPTVLRIGPYRFHFYAADGGERPHVHVVGPFQGQPKFWLNPVAIADEASASRRTLRELERLVIENQGLLLRSWNEFFAK